MAAYMYNKHHRFCYVDFCEKCFAPKKFSDEIIQYYLIGMDIDDYFCQNCGHKNKLPGHIMSILDELLKHSGNVKKS